MNKSFFICVAAFASLSFVQVLAAQSLEYTCSFADPITSPAVNEGISGSLPLKLCGTTKSRVRIYVPSEQACDSANPGELSGLITLWSRDNPPGSSTMRHQLRGFFILGQKRTEQGRSFRFCKSYLALQSIVPTEQRASWSLVPTMHNGEDDDTCDSLYVQVKVNETMSFQGSGYPASVVCNLTVNDSGK